MLKVSYFKSYKPALLRSTLYVCVSNLFSVSIYVILALIWAGNHIAYAQTNQFLIGMPFAGKWAYNSKVNPPYNDVNSSHPTAHKTDLNDKYDWATDLYTLPNTPVKINIKNFRAGDTLTVSNVTETSCGAGMRVRVLVKNSSGTEIGWVQYEHIETSLKNNTQISNNSVLGVTKNWKTIRGKPLSCYVIKDDNGVHVHVSMNNSQGNHSCYVDHGTPGNILAESDNFGVIGASNIERKKPCTTLPSTNTVAPKPTTGNQGTDSIPLGTSAGTTIQGSSGQKVQNTDSGKKIQGADSQKPNTTTTQTTKPENNGIVTKVVNFFKNVTSIFSKDKPITPTASKTQTQPAKNVTNKKPTPAPSATPTTPSTPTSATTPEPVETKTFDENGCPIGEPKVELTSIQILGYNTQEEFETFEGTKDLLLIVTGIFTNPTAADVDINAVGLYRESENTDFPPQISLSVQSMELPNKSSIIKAQSSTEFKSKRFLMWSTSYGTLTKNLTPTLRYPANPGSRPQSWWWWPDKNSTRISEKCQPNYYE